MKLRSGTAYSGPVYVPRVVNPQAGSPRFNPFIPLATALGGFVVNQLRGRFTDYLGNRIMGPPRKRIAGRSVRSAGFAGRKMKKLKRTNRPKLGLKKTSGSAPYVNLVTELGGSKTDPDCVYVGHATAPSYLMLRVMCMALTKKLCAGYGIYIENFKDIVDERLRDVKVGLDFYSSSSSTSSSFTTYIILTADTYEAVAIAIRNLIQVEATAHRDVEFRKLVLYRGSEDKVEIDLYRLKFQLQSKTSLKLQNRSKGALGTEADEVDNVPVYGRSYQANTTGLTYADGHRGNPGFNAYRDTGLITFLGSDDPRGSLKEPPVPGTFVNCKMFGKVRIEPGTVKTSVLYTKHSLRLDEFVRIVYPSTGAVAATTYKLGKTRVFAMEKIIDTQEAEPPAIVIGYEINNAMYCSLKYMKGTGTATLFNKTTTP